MKIIFRACEKQGSVNGVPRPWEMDKPEVLDLCFRSLHLALRDKPHKVYIIGDSLSEERTAFFKELEPDCVIDNYTDLGNDGSILKSFEVSSARILVTEYPKDFTSLSIPRAVTTTSDNC